METTEKKWYQKTGGIYTLCFVFFPVGLYLLWKNQEITKKKKIFISCLIAVFLIIFSNNKKGSNSNKYDNEIANILSQRLQEWQNIHQDVELHYDDSNFHYGDIEKIGDDGEFSITVKYTVSFVDRTTRASTDQEHENIYFFNKQGDIINTSNIK